MRILFVHDHLFLGGAAKAALRMRRICRELGHETFSAHGDESTMAHFPSVVVHGKGSRIQRFWEFCLPANSQKHLRQKRAATNFKALLKKESFDFVWFQNIEGAKKWGWSSAWIAMALENGKVAITMHDMQYLGLGSSYVWDRPLRPTAFAGLTDPRALEATKAGFLTINACSLWLGSLCKKLYGISCRQLTVPLWSEDFCVGPRDRTDPKITRYLVVAENLQDQRKNILPTLRCLLENKILEKTKSVIYCLGRALPPEFRGPNIRPLGHIEDSLRYRSLYDEVDYLLHPSLIDNFPLVIQESLAQGRPIIALDRGGVGEMVQHGETGYLYDETNSESLERAFKKSSMLSGGDYQENSKKSREFALKKYANLAVASQYRSLLENLVNTK